MPRQALLRGYIKAVAVVNHLDRNTGAIWADIHDD